MANPMYCPMAFNNGPINQTTVINEEEITVTKDSLMECNPNCAWAINYDGNIFCAVAFHDLGTHSNSFIPERIE